MNFTKAELPDRIHQLEHVRKCNAEFWEEFPTATMSNAGDAPRDVWEEALGWEDYACRLAAAIREAQFTVVV